VKGVGVVSRWRRGFESVLCGGERGGRCCVEEESNDRNGIPDCASMPEPIRVASTGRRRRAPSADMRG
jgi:hypothetical protein